MIHLELSDIEAKDLKTSLSIRLVGLREELVHTDNREYRDYVRTTLDRLEVIDARLEELLAAAGKQA